MRVIAGSARRLLLKTPAGMDTRPTADKYKETLFNVLQPYLYADTEFLDLFAGSGALSLEALSRGASYAVLGDIDRNACAVQKKNISPVPLTKRPGFNASTRIHPKNDRKRVRGGTFQAVREIDKKLTPYITPFIIQSWHNGKNY